MQLLYTYAMHWEENLLEEDSGLVRAVMDVGIAGDVKKANYLLISFSVTALMASAFFWAYAYHVENYSYGKYNLPPQVLQQLSATARAQIYNANLQR